MRLFLTWLPLLLCGAVFLCDTEARRIRVERPVEEEDEQETVNYYAAEPQENQRRVVLVSSADQYNGLYGQPTASSRSGQDNYISRGSVKAHESTRSKESAKAPPVQTIRNYNKVNDDGSFTFGYESADGSFKEETRGTDCVVRGKYGYIDPDGNKREFTYVSGNPCDPNAPKGQDESPEESNEAETDNGPANYPSRPIQPIRRPISEAKPAITLFQNNYAREEEQPEEQLLRATPQSIRRPTYISRPQYLQTDTDGAAQVYQRAQAVPTTTPASVIYKSSIFPVNITPRPVTPTPSARTQLPATTYRPQLLQVAVTPRPSIQYTKQLQSFLPSSTAATPSRDIDFDNEFQKFQIENNIVSPTPTPLASKVATTPRPKPANTAGQIYSTALVYDPSSGQYNNQLYQTLPQADGDFLLKQRIQPYVAQTQRPQVVNIQQLRQQSPLYNPNLRQTQSQAAYQAQQAELQFQNSAQLYAQQQRARAQQQHQQQQPQQQQQQVRQSAAPQPVYYIQPSADQTGALATTQLDAFLRGHNIQF